MKYKHILLSFTFLFGTLFSVSAQFSGGNGSQGNPYRISTVEDLKTLSENSQFWGPISFVQTQDIIIPDEAYEPDGIFYNDGKGFSPIGRGSTFGGSYNGGDYVIENLLINRPDEDSVGFVASGLNVNFTYMHLRKLKVTGNRQVGGIIGTVYVADIKYCSVEGEVTGNVNYIGGICGQSSSGHVFQCKFSGTVKGNTSVGGIVGVNFTSGTIVECFSTGNFTGLYSVGALLGYNYTNSVVSNSFSQGNVKAGRDAGGLVGSNSVSSTVINCYSIAKVQKFPYMGGLIGKNSSSNLFDNSFWTQSFSGVDSSAGGTLKDSMGLTDSTTFKNAGWNFSTIWTIGSLCDEGNVKFLGMPVLRWMNNKLETLPNYPALNFILTPTCENVNSGKIAWDNSNGDPSPLTFYWNNSKTSNSIQDLSRGSYFVSINDENQCRTRRNFILTEKYSPSAQGILLNQQSETVYSFELNTPTDVLDYLWDFGDGETSSDPNPTHTFPGTGEYLIQVTIFNSCGDQSFSTNLYVIHEGVLPISTFANIHFYPNPATQNLTFSGIQTETLLNILTIDGTQIYQTLLTPNTGSLDISELPAGFYFLRLSTLGENITYKLLILNE